MQAAPRGNYLIAKKGPKENTMRIIVVENERLLGLTLKASLEQPINPNQEPHVIHLASSFEDAMRVIEKETIDIAFLDIDLGENHKDGGIKLLKYFRKHYPSTVVIIMTGMEADKIIEECLQIGAADYIFKPFEPRRVHHLMMKAIVQHRLFRRTESLRVQGGDRVAEPIELKSKSPCFNEVIELAKRIKGKKLRALITGESGTGKEVMARFIWSQEGDLTRPFIPVHCGAIPENLVESNLFGHVKGAFTGAISDKKGYFEAADGGDIFLDEIGTMPLDVQVKLLRALNSGEITRVGSNKGKCFNFRVIAATNENIEELTKQGRFREDLLFRLKEVELHLPPLRDRKEDIIDLIHSFLNKNGHHEKYFSIDALDIFLSYTWPGNIRQLEKTVSVLAELAEKQEITAEEVRRQLGINSPSNHQSLVDSSSEDKVINGSLCQIQPTEIEGRFQHVLEDVEKKMIRFALEKEPSESQAAKFLGMPRNSLRRRIHEWGWKSQ